ncbi:MAG: low molecular weight protein arginine phosphatase, partial [Clostridia bacterium]|nr:low molecular weight protein arginine phosphatase [Clostridia bacterium]
MKILFLCDGNTCRSPVAEAVMNKKAFEQGLDIVSESAGLQAFSGDEANEYSVKAA